MNERQAASVWRACRGVHYNAIARFLEVGPLAGEHVVEIEPHPKVPVDIKQLLALADQRSIELSYGTSPRRVMVLS